MALVNFTNLDFEDIKTSIKDYLKTNSNFTDYDFEGSSLSVLIDVLAYNTYINSYNANMISNELFLDGATLRENVVSLARNIGYVPRSKTASKTKVSFFVDLSGLDVRPLTVTLKKGICFTTLTTFGRESNSFSIPEDVTVPVKDGIASFDDITIYEGTLITQNFTVDSTNYQRFILDNPGIDTSTISVTVKDNALSSDTKVFKYIDSIVNIDSTSKIFLIQEIEDERYELLFGDGLFGKKLVNGNYVTVSYVVTNGEVANGITNFTYAGRLVANDGSIINSQISLVTSNGPTSGGQQIESVSYIKKYAPKIYSSQNRAVTANDYEALIPKIYPETESISVFGGETLEPPEYGKVFIAIKPTNGFFLSSASKEFIKSELRKYSVAGIVPVFMDLKYLNVEYETTIYYNKNLASNENVVLNSVYNNILEYTKSSEINRYGARFKYSKFLKLIDDSNSAITSNITKVSMRRDLRVNINAFGNYEICFGNEFHIKNPQGQNIKSSGFKVEGFENYVYLTDFPDLNNPTQGKLFVFDGESQNYFNEVGKVNYETGEIFLQSISVTGTEITQDGEPVIMISAIPKSNDIIGLQDLYLQIDINRSKLTILSDDISSGADSSGSTYLTTSSYPNGPQILK
jgi:hypothetical protein